MLFKSYAVEKNIKAFLDLDLEGTKVIIGKGPDLKNLKKKFPKDIFLGERTNGELASHFASSDVFVFPLAYVILSPSSSLWSNFEVVSLILHSMKFSFSV